MRLTVKKLALNILHLNVWVQLRECSLSLDWNVLKSWKRLNIVSMSMKDIFLNNLHEARGV